MSDCIFCKLANGVIPTATLYEDSLFRVILDANPATKGHCLILPKEHYANLWEMPEDLTAKAFVLARRIAAAMTEAMHFDGFNIGQNNGTAAGQTVFHFHIQLIPRYKDGPAIVANWPQSPLTDGDRDAILSAFRKVMAGKS